MITRIDDEFIEEIKLRALARGEITEAIGLAKHTVASPRVRLKFQHELLHGRKGPIEPGTTLDGNWAEQLADATASQSAFIEHIQPRSAFDYCVAAGAPVIPLGATTRAFTYASSLGNAVSVAEGQPKPLTSYELTRSALDPMKVAAAVVITNDLMKLSNAEDVLRRLLANSIVSATNDSFFSTLIGSGTPEVSATSDVLADLSAAAAMMNLSAASKLVLFAPVENVVSLALTKATTGEVAFPSLSVTGIGEISGIAVVGVDGLSDVALLIDIAQLVVSSTPLDVKASSRGTILMSDSPTSPANQVSLFQTDSTCLLAERWLSVFAVEGSTVQIEGVNW